MVHPERKRQPGSNLISGFHYGYILLTALPSCSSKKEYIILPSQIFPFLFMDSISHDGSCLLSKLHSWTSQEIYPKGRRAEKRSGMSAAVKYVVTKPSFPAIASITAGENLDISKSQRHFWTRRDFGTPLRSSHEKVGFEDVAQLGFTWEHWMVWQSRPCFFRPNTWQKRLSKVCYYFIGECVISTATWWEKKDNFPSSSVTVFDNLAHRLSLLSHRLRDPEMQHIARKNSSRN